MLCQLVIMFIIFQLNVLIKHNKYAIFTNDSNHPGDDGERSIMLN